MRRAKWHKLWCVAPHTHTPTLGATGVRRAGSGARPPPPSDIVGGQGRFGCAQDSVGALRGATELGRSKLNCARGQIRYYLVRFWPPAPGGLPVAAASELITLVSVPLAWRAGQAKHDDAARARPVCDHLRQLAGRPARYWAINRAGEPSRCQLCLSKTSARVPRCVRDSGPPHANGCARARNGGAELCARVLLAYWSGSANWARPTSGFCGQVSEAN